MEEETLFFEFNKRKFKKLSKKYCKTYLAWWSWMLSSVGSIVLAAACVLYLIYLYRSGSLALLFSNRIIGVIFCVCIFIAAFLLFSSYVFYTSANRGYGMPYTYMTDPIVYATPNEIGIEYHNKFDRKNKDSMDVARIKLSKLTKVEYVPELKLYVLYGNTEFIQYENMETDTILHSYTHGQLGEKQTFSFFDCIPNIDELLEYFEEHDIEVEVTPKRKRKELKKLCDTTNIQNWIYIDLI